MSKDKILNFLIKENRIKFPALYLGDSKFDHEIAKKAGIDFIFVSQWSEFEDWQNYCKANEIKSIKSLAELI